MEKFLVALHDGCIVWCIKRPHQAQHYKDIFLRFAKYAVLIFMDKRHTTKSMKISMHTPESIQSDQAYTK